jgi:uncharacterized protein YndB with AHSA1/START domain
MSFKKARHFAVPANVVFTLLADPERAARWLAPQQPQELRLSVVPAEMAVRWGRDGGWTGRALVREANDGGSVVYVELNEPTTGGDRLLADAIDRLAAEVATLT